MAFSIEYAKCYICGLTPFTDDHEKSVVFDHLLGDKVHLCSNKCFRYYKSTSSHFRDNPTLRNFNIFFKDLLKKRDFSPMKKNCNVVVNDRENNLKKITKIPPVQLDKKEAKEKKD
jgi:hypothetical protein